MADKLRLGTEVRELKIGQSFTNPKAGALHAIRYDFKPASVDLNKIATVDVGSGNQVTVTVPHLDEAVVPQTVFKGSQRPFHKECVLIIDRVTGEITLEKLTSNIQLKKTRFESAKSQLPQDRIAERSLTSARPQTPPIGQRQSNKTRVTSGSRRADRQITQITHLPKHSPLHASPNPQYPSPGHKSPKRDRDESHSQSALASLPMIGMEDFSDPVPAPAPPPPAPVATSQNGTFSSVFNSHSDNEMNGDAIGEISDSSSSDSSSDSDSDHDSAPESKTVKPPISRSNGHGQVGRGLALPPNPTPPPAKHTNQMSMPITLLNDDLCLSESGSDSD
ncbi:PREDICTED: ell-associated factor Eaf [Nicrophorus vespilloides]|uniref:Ell-associated factor Eaf n=1 Tax=Nicrophorus vespilloides TaxID=110193 RepID=A0ABM1N4F3_NICVS|nr:PREDICTED: ell-associated factor Eaf [Nicrophorus vespilloides]